MDKKAIVKLFLVIGAILVAGYLSFDLVSENISRQNANESFCNQKCNFSNYSYFWEFTGGNTAVGFTTKDECMKYCIRQKEGYAYRFLSDSYASMISSPPVSGILRFFGLK